MINNNNLMTEHQKLYLYLSEIKEANTLFLKRKDYLPKKIDSRLCAGHQRYRTEGEEGSLTKHASDSTHEFALSCHEIETHLSSESRRNERGRETDRRDERPTTIRSHFGNRRVLDAVAPREKYIPEV